MKVKGSLLANAKAQVLKNVVEFSLLTRVFMPCKNE